MLSYRARWGIGLAGGTLAAVLAWNGSGKAWGRSGEAFVVRKTVQGAGLPGYETGALRLVLDNPPPGSPGPGLLVPREIFETIREGDVLAWRRRALPAAGIEAFDFEARRDGAAVARWREGYPFLFAGIAALGLGAAIALWGLAGLLNALFRLSAPPDA